MQDTMLTVCATIAMAIMMTPIRMNVVTIGVIFLIGLMFPVVWFAGLLRGLVSLVGNT